MLIMEKMKGVECMQSDICDGDEEI